MKQEKLCETEDMTDKDYSRYYADPVEQQKFNEDMGVENVKQMIAGIASTRQVAGDHYKRMDIQPWDVVDYGPKQQAIGFYRYNALKYIMRAGEKGDFKEDIAKAQHYLEKLLEIL
jgi:hypothetical protein